MSQIFFSAWDPQTPPGPLISPLELWGTDGTAAGVHFIKNIFAAPYDPNTADGGSDPDQFTAGALMFFTANDGVHGRELWASDGTTAGTVMLRDIQPDQSFIFSGPTSLTAANGRLYFAMDDAVHGYELWTSDGTPSGTVMVTDIDGTQNGSLGGAIGSLNGIAYFTARDGVHGYELWRSDGTAAGTFMVKDTLPGAADGSPFGFTVTFAGIETFFFDR